MACMSEVTVALLLDVVLHHVGIEKARLIARDLETIRGSAEFRQTIERISKQLQTWESTS